MKILVACEESQAVTKGFRKFGHEAFSCDLYDCSSGENSGATLTYTQHVAVYQPL